jgi:hypothetical protein
MKRLGVSGTRTSFLEYDLAQGHGNAQVGAGSLSVSSLNHLPIRYYAALTAAWSRTSVSIVTT